MEVVNFSTALWALPHGVGNCASGLVCFPLSLQRTCHWAAWCTDCTIGIAICVVRYLSRVEVCHSCHCGVSDISLYCLMCSVFPAGLNYGRPSSEGKEMLSAAAGVLFARRWPRKPSLGDGGEILLVHKWGRLSPLISILRTNELVFIRSFDIYQIKSIS